MREDLLPYLSNAWLQNDRQIIALLTHLDFILTTLIQSQKAFYQDKSDHLFDPHPNETCCQVRAVIYLLRDTQTSKSPLELKHQVAYFSSLKKRVAEKRNHFSSNPAHKKITLSDFLKEQELVILLSAVDQFIFASYFLTTQRDEKILHEHYQQKINQFAHDAIIHISLDIAHRKKLSASLQLAKKQAEAANRAKTEFLENMRHDIRTPLSGIVGFAQLIQKEASNATVKEYADNLIQATSALLDFQNEILEMIKITTGHDSVVFETVDLEKQIKKIMDLLKPKAIVKNLILSYEYNKNVPRFFSTDAKRLFRILLELITNAIKFTAQGSVQLMVSPEKINDQPMRVRFDVVDTGIGIPPDKQDAIFVRFHRLSPSSNGVYEGTGLGLTVTKKLVKELNGKIQVFNNKSGGTIVSCIIPMMMVDAIDASPESIFSQKTTFDHPAILLIEDHEMTATVTKLLLTDMGCVVTIANDAKTALSLLTTKYDLILLDVGLPDCDGFRLAKKIREIENGVTPIVALTAHKEKDTQVRCDESGINAIYQKPLLQSTAIQLLNRYLLKSSDVMQKTMNELLREHIHDDQKHIQHALLEKNWEKLRDANHKLLGALLYCDVPTLTAASQQLQNAFSHNRAEHYVNFTQQLLREIHAYINL